MSNKKDPRGGVHPLHYTETELARIAELYHMHWSIQRIADDIGRSRHSVNAQLDKMRAADPTFKRKFRAKEPTSDSLRRRFGTGMGEMHTEMKKLTVDARIWLHEEALKQGYASVAEMVVDHFMENYNERA